MPRFSLVTVIQEPPGPALQETVVSVLSQEHDDWEWIVVDDCSSSASTRQSLSKLAEDEPRVDVRFRETRGGTRAAFHDALTRTSGEFVVLLDAADVLAARALPRVAMALEAHPEADYLYSDHDQLTESGEKHSPYIKPDWSPERFRHHLYARHLSVIRRSLAMDAVEAGPDDHETGDEDLLLRVTETAREVVHVREILYHRRDRPGSTDAGDPQSEAREWHAGVWAVQRHLDRGGISGRVSRGRFPGLFRIEREPDLHTPVSIIIPTIGSTGHVRGGSRTMVVEAIRSILQRSAHPDIEFVVVHDTATPPSVLAELRGLPLEPARLRLVEFTGPFNFSEKCNVGALHANGDYLVFLNDDMEAVSDGVVEQLIAPLSESGVGATGAKLLFEDERVQHAGLVYGSGRIAHSYYQMERSAQESCPDLWINREVSGLTGACLAVRRDVFDEVGGFTETLPVNYNDVDFGQKVRRTGRRLIWLHDVVLYHYESVTRSTEVHEWEADLIRRRWGDYRKLQERYPVR